MIHPLSPFTQFSFPPHFGNTYQPLKDNLPTTNISNHPIHTFSIPTDRRSPIQPMLEKTIGISAIIDSQIQYSANTQSLSIIDTNGQISSHDLSNFQGISILCIGDAAIAAANHLHQFIPNANSCIITADGSPVNVPDSSTYVVSDSPLHFSPAEAGKKALLYLLNSKKNNQFCLGIISDNASEICCLPRIPESQYNQLNQVMKNQQIPYNDRICIKKAFCFLSNGGLFSHCDHGAVALISNAEQNPIDIAHGMGMAQKMNHPISKIHDLIEQYELPLSIDPLSLDDLNINNNQISNTIKTHVISDPCSLAQRLKSTLFAFNVPDSAKMQASVIHYSDYLWALISTIHSSTTTYVDGGECFVPLDSYPHPQTMHHQPLAILMMIMLQKLYHRYQLNQPFPKFQLTLCSTNHSKGAYYYFLDSNYISNIDALNLNLFNDPIQISNIDQLLHHHGCIKKMISTPSLYNMGDIMTLQIFGA